MRTERLNAFTDGVLAIIITIMVLELPLPHGDRLSSIRPILPLLGAYALSFVNVGIFWNNHHHLMQLVKKVDGRVLWANLLLLFWLSLVPFVIRWIGEAHLGPGPVAAYGIVMVGAAISYLLLERAAVAADPDTDLAGAVGGGRKEWLSFTLYLTAIPLAFVSPWISIGMYVLVSAIWFIPDSRVERQLKGRQA